MSDSWDFRGSAGRATRLAMTEFRSFSSLFARSIIWLVQWCKRPMNLAVVVGFIFYVYEYSQISILKVYALSAAVYDLGNTFEGGWLVFHSSLNFGYLQSFLRSPMVFLLAPLTITGNADAVLILQSIFLAAPVFAIYAIAKNRLKNEFAAGLIGFAYLAYFPLAGVNWFDFHEEIFFLIFFTVGYYAYVKGYYSLALCLLFFSGFLRYPYIIFPALFAGFECLELLFARIRTPPVPVPKVRLKFGLYLLFMSIGWFALVYGLHGGLSYFQTVSFSTAASTPAVNAANNVFTLLLFLAPLLFVPLFSIRFSVMLLPYCYLLFATDFYGFSYPGIFREQYGLMVIPFLFLGLIEGLVVVSRVLPESHLTKLDQTTKIGIEHVVRRRRTTYAGVILVAVLLMGVIYLPYGPLNSYTTSSFGFASSTTVNWTRYNAFAEVSALIPRDDPYVLVQNDMPLLFPRPIPVIMLDAGTLTTFGNITIADAVANRFPYFDGTVWSTTKIDYVVADAFASVSISYSTNAIFPILATLYASGAYGIRAEMDGFLLLERGYSGPIAYSPISEHFTPVEAFNNPPPNTTIVGGVMISHNVSLTSFGWGIWQWLLPGTYSISLRFLSENDSPQNIVDFDVYQEWGVKQVHLQEFNGSSLALPGQWGLLSYTISINTFYIEVQYPLWFPHWNGNVAVGNFSLTEVSPPSVEINSES
jgi:uncharacterized membrane protein